MVCALCSVSCVTSAQLGPTMILCRYASPWTAFCRPPPAFSSFPWISLSFGLCPPYLRPSLPPWACTHEAGRTENPFPDAVYNKAVHVTKAGDNVAGQLHMKFKLMFTQNYLLIFLAPPLCSAHHFFPLTEKIIPQLHNYVESDVLRELEQLKQNWNNAEVT